MKKLRNNKKGFTLAELLVVVAIIAVLVAIAIPAFSVAMERAREATIKANARSIHAECMVAILDTDRTSTAITSNKSGDVTTYTATGLSYGDDTEVTYTWKYVDDENVATVTIAATSGAYTSLNGEVYSFGTNALLN